MPMTKKPRESSASPRLFSIADPKFRSRVLVALIGGTISILAILATSEAPITLLIAAAGWFAAIEVQRLFGGASKTSSIITMLIAVAALLGLSRVMLAPEAAPYPPLIAVILGTIGIYLRLKRGTPHPIDALALGWIAGPFACALWLHQESAVPSRMFSSNLLGLVALPLWLGDTAAYFVGKRYGKHLVAPKISPKKTWEGSIANLLMCVLASFFIAHLLNSGLAHPLPQGVVLSIGVITGILGQVGDFLQSAIKRAAGVKDSGDILPGHGGILDRLDSFLFAAVPVSLVLWFFARASFT